MDKADKTEGYQTAVINNLSDILACSLALSGLASKNFITAVTEIRP